MCPPPYTSCFSEGLMTPGGGGDAKFPLTTWPTAFSVLLTQATVL